jgi:hypothetical protein
MTRTVVAAAIAAGCVVIAVAGIAHATNPASDDVVRACYHSKTGALRVVDPRRGESCNKHEKRLDWNRQGVPGVPGTAGVSGYEIVKAEAGSNQPGVAVGSHPGTTLDEQGTRSATAYCPSGKKVTGGGVDVSFAPGITVNASYPQNPPGQTGPSEQDGGWSGYATIDPSLQGSRRWTIKVWAFCTTVAPH